MKSSNANKQKKTIVSIIGEHPDNDALALSYILKDVVKSDVQFSFPLKQYRGGDLDSKSFLNEPPRSVTTAWPPCRVN